MTDFENIYLTGDKHADFEDLVLKSICYGFTERDLIIILGDVGINFFGDYRDILHKDMLAQVPCTILCVRGNHEMRPTDPALGGVYHEIDWMGDKAYVEDEYPRFIMAADGARYHINDRDFLVIGGAYSVDRPWRIANGAGWFSDEQLTPTEMEVIRQSVSAHGNQEDIILAHTCPYNYRPVECFLSGVDESSVDSSMERFLQVIIDMTDWSEFYCGHWHIDKQVAAGPGGQRKLRFLFHDIVMLITGGKREDDNSEMSSQ